MTPQADNWDLHWEQYQESSDASPACAMRLRLGRRLCRLDAARAPVRMLELGSGTGELASYLLAHHAGIEYLGLDVSPLAVEQAGRRIPQARFATANLMEPAPKEAAGYAATHALCTEVLEHVDDPVTLLRNARAWMQPGCRLVVTVPGGPMSAFDKHIGHRRHFSPRDLARLLAEAGYAVKECHGTGFPFFNLYRLTVIARGERLITDVAGGPSRVARAVMQTYGLLFRLSTSRWGWQTVAVAETLFPDGP